MSNQECEIKDSTFIPNAEDLDATLQHLIIQSKAHGYITYDELNAVLPSGISSSERMDDILNMFSKAGIHVVVDPKNEEDAEDIQECDNFNENEEEGEASRGNINEDLGRADDPVRMYLREMGSVELLSREGEIAIAKRIEASREIMIQGLCLSPITMNAITEWGRSLRDGQMLLRDVIDLDSTYNQMIEQHDDENKSRYGYHAAPEETIQDPPSTNKVAHANLAPVTQDKESNKESDAHSPDIDASDDEAEEDETALSLTAMERLLKPEALSQLEMIEKAYESFEKVRRQRFTAFKKGTQPSDRLEKRYIKQREAVTSLMKNRPTHPKLYRLFSREDSHDKQGLVAARKSASTAGRACRY